MKIATNKSSQYSLFAISLLLAFALGTKAHNFSLNNFSPTSKNKSLTKNLNYNSVDEVYSALKDDFDGSLDNQKLLDGVKKGLVEASGDPYTSYLTASEAKLFDSSLAGKFSGIGAELGRNEGRPVVISAIAGYPAAKAGVKAKDIVIKINGEDTASLSLDEAVLKIRGEIGTKVTLELLRGTETITKEISRDQIKTPSVTHEIIADGTIGYLRLTQFGEDTDELADQAAKEFTDKGVKAVILDLRDNGGGLLPSSTHIGGLWLPNKVVVREKRDGKVTEELRGDGTGPFANLPSVVLVNGGSASASEIVAGALQDTKAATIVGEKTFGKGSVQAAIDLNHGGSLKVTIAHWFTPKDRSTDKVGFKPDIEVLPGNDPTQDVQKNKAVELLKSKF